MHLWIVLHVHQYGTTTGLIEADHQPGDAECIKALGLDFEPEKGESIEVVLVDRSEIITLPPTLPSW
jgi:hypothetical protein